MNRDDILRMAKEAGFRTRGELIRTMHSSGAWVGINEELELFAALVAAAEREACARFVEEGHVRQFENPWREDLAAAIRTRGEK